MSVAEGTGAEVSTVGAGASLLGAGAGASLDDAPGVGIVIGTPAAAQIPSSVEMTLAWSSAEHAFCTQGVTEGVRISALPHEQAKSVGSQPVALTPVRTQEREQDGRSVMDCAVARAARREKAAKVVFIVVVGWIVE